MDLPKATQQTKAGVGPKSCQRRQRRFLVREIKGSFRPRGESPSPPPQGPGLCFLMPGVQRPVTAHPRVQLLEPSQGKTQGGSCPHPILDQVRSVLNAGL